MTTPQPDPDLTDELRAEPTTGAELLPVLAADGGLDVDGLAALAPDLGRQLVDAVRASATLHRQARGAVVTPEDTYGLVRRLTAGGEVLRRVGRVFDAAAAECDAITEEEALTAVGEQDGVPNASLFVPDGQGQRIAVRADYAAGDSSWDVSSLIGLLAEEGANSWRSGRADRWWSDLRASDLDDPDLVAEDRDAILLDAVATLAENLAAAAMGRLVGLGRYQPAVTKIEELRVQAAEQGDDPTAAVLGQLRTRGERRFLGVKITREAQPKGRGK